MARSVTDGSTEVGSGRPLKPATALGSVIVVLALLGAACDGGGSGSATPTTRPIAGSTSPEPLNPTVPVGVDDETRGAGLGGAGAGEGVGDPVEADTASGWNIHHVLAADPSCATPATGRPLLIGHAADLSGVDAAIDEVAVEASRHMAALINCSGGVGGNPIEIVVGDVGGPPAAARDVVDELVDGGVVALIGPRDGEIGLRVLRAAGARVPVVFATATEPALASRSDLGFLVGVDDGRAAVAAADFALAQGWEVAATVSAVGPRVGYGPLVFADRFASGGGQLLTDVVSTPMDLLAIIDDGEVDREDVDGESAAALDQGEESEGAGSVGEAGGSAGFDASMVVDELAALDEMPDVLYTTLPIDAVAALRTALASAGLGVAVITEDGLAPVLASAGPIRLPGDEADIDRLEGVYYVGQAVFGSGARASQFDGSVVLATGARPANPAAAAMVADAVIVIADARLRMWPDGAIGPTAPIDPVDLAGSILRSGHVDAITGDLRYAGRPVPGKSVPILRIQGGEPTQVATIDLG